MLFTAFAKPLLMPPPLQHTPSLNLFSQITTFYTSQCHGFLPLSVPLPSAFIVSYVCVRAQSCITLCSFMGYSPPGSSIQGIFQARILGLVAIFMGFSQPRDRNCVSCISCIGRWILYHCATWEAPVKINLNQNVRRQNKG